MKNIFPFILSALVSTSTASEAPARNETTIVLDATAVSNLGIKTIEAEQNAFERTIFTLGTTECPSDARSSLTSRSAGRIVETLAQQGDFVAKDQVLARMESRQPGSPPPIIDLKAPAAGLIAESKIHLGSPVEPDEALMELLDLNRIWISTGIPQHQASQLSEQSAARIRIPAIGTTQAVAKFLRLDAKADPEMGTINAIFELANPDKKIRPGMRAELIITTDKRAEVLSIPRSALQGDGTNRFVFIKDYELANAFVRLPVVIGETNNERVEISSGLYPGDEVVTEGAYALSFAGKGSVSLKEALDAAHGHPHNEDGSEMTKEQIASANGEAHDHDHAGNGLVIFLSITCALLTASLALAIRSLRKRSKA